MTITRRELLRRAGLLGAATLIPTFSACTSDPAGTDGETGDTGDTGDTGETGEPGDDLPIYEWDGELGPETIFAHSVASGDPLADAVILWTRVSPAVDEPVETFFEVALDPEFAMRVAADYIPTTDDSRDYTVKIDVDNLAADTTYYYRFYAQGRVSPVGRTRTAASGEVDHLRFGVVSCSSLGHGYFQVYREMSTYDDLSAVLHLGDYIYEFGTGTYGDIREYDPPYEIVSLDDYRRRYRQYGSDPDLQALRAAHPLITTWDDHEITNDGYANGAANHDDATEGPWAERKAVATQAYFEWLPIREGVPGRVYRNFAFGDLVDLIVLDTRYEGRDEQVNLADPDWGTQIYDESRKLLGDEQEAWLYGLLDASTARWKLVAQQIMVGQMIITPATNGNPNKPLFADPWDGYEPDRRRLLGHIRDNAISNVVVLTGDVHSSFANELTENPLDGYDPATGEGAVAVEFVTPGVTSPGLGFDDSTLAVILANNPHIRFIEALRKGYMLVDVTTERVEVEFRLYTAQQVGIPEFSASSFGGRWEVLDGVPRIYEV